VNFWRIKNSPDAKPVWTLARLTTISLYTVAGGIFAAGIFIIGEDVLRYINGLEARIAELGSWALVVFILLYIILGTFFVPDVVLGIVAGTTFGFTTGIVAATLGSLGGAVLQYGLARRLFRPVVEKFIVSRPALAGLQAAVRKQEFRLQLLIRLTPLNRTLTNYILGASGVGFTRFIAACVGFLPTLCLEVYFGYAGKQMVGMTGKSGHETLLHNIMLLTGLIAAIVAMVVISRMARQAVEAVAIPTHPLE